MKVGTVFGARPLCPSFVLANNVRIVLIIAWWLRIEQLYRLFYDTCWIGCRWEMLRPANRHVVRFVGFFGA
jgi:hypothetical protein